MRIFEQRVLENKSKILTPKTPVLISPLSIQVISLRTRSVMADVPICFNAKVTKSFFFKWSITWTQPYWCSYQFWNEKVDNNLMVGKYFSGLCDTGIVSNHYSSGFQSAKIQFSNYKIRENTTETLFTFFTRDFHDFTKKLAKT